MASSRPSRSWSGNGSLGVETMSRSLGGSNRVAGPCPGANDGKPQRPMSRRVDFEGYSMVKFWPFRHLDLISHGLEQSRHWARPQLLAPTNPNSPPSTTRPEHLTVIRLPVPTKIRVVSVCVWIVGARAGSIFFFLFCFS